MIKAEAEVEKKNVEQEDRVTIQSSGHSCSRAKLE
jgi:hypothetical protein